MDSLIGCYASSKAGHDQNEVYVVVAQYEDYVILCNGGSKTLANPKKKKKKHIQLIRNGVDESLLQRLQAGETVWDHEIRCAIRRYRKRVENEVEEKYGKE